MRSARTPIIIVASLGCAGLLVLAPFSCARESRRGDGSTRLAQPRDTAAPSFAFLPHPAFAQAKAAGSATVTIADVAERALPAVVSVASTRVSRARAPELPFQDHPFFRRFFGPDSPFSFPNPGGEMPEQRGLGSGVIVGKDLILTNAHVVEDAKELEITTENRRELKAKLVGSDPKSDLAVLRIQGDTSDLKTLELADSARMRLGDVVLAIGNPFGVGQTVTMGIVSAKGRANVGIVDYEDFIQTDAAINPGNSGGALVDMEGKLVGIPTAILSRSGGYMGIGFAIPSNMAKPIMQSLVEHGKVVRGWLGVGIQDITADLARAMNLPSTSGVLISDVNPRSPAAKGGVQRGDVVLSIDGRAITSTGQLRNMVAAAGVGKTLNLEVLRNGKRESLKVTLGEMPAEATPGGGAEPGDGRSGIDGLTAAPLDAATRARFKIPASVTRGLVITGVQSGSTAARVGLRPGDVVLEANKKPVNSIAELNAAWKNQSGPVPLLVWREGHTLYLAASPAK